MIELLLIDLNVHSNFLRPDGKDRYEVIGVLEMQDGNQVIKLNQSYFEYFKPNTDGARILVEFVLPDTTLTLGGTLTNNRVYPDLGISQIVYRGEQSNLRLGYSYGINREDSQALVKGVMGHTISAYYWSTDGEGGGKVTFNDDRGTVIEGYFTVPLVENQSVAFTGYTRAVQGGEDNYWSPNFYGNIGVRLAIELGDSCRAGIIPGLEVEEGTVSVGVVPGFDCQIINSEDFAINVSLGYTYGFNGRLGIRYHF